MAKDDRGTATRGTGSDEARAAALDAQAAVLAGLATVSAALQIGQLAGDEIGAVLRHVEHAVRRFEAAPGPLTRRVVAQDLLDAYRLLRDRERGARAEGNVLLKDVRISGTPVKRLPWTLARPTRLEDVAAEGSSSPFFASHEVERWLSALEYRPPEGRTRRGPRAPSARSSGPLDSTGVHPFHLTYVQGRGKGARRSTLHWPLPALVVPNAYRIELVKLPGMSFSTREGRIAVLAYLLEVLAETNGDGDVYWSDKREYVTTVQLARHVVETADIALGRVLFEGPESSFRVFERAPVRYVTDFVVTDSLIEILWHYTEIKPKFRSELSPKEKRGCASIDWITELLKEVPHRYKELWVQDRMMNDRAVYPNHLKPGMVVPAQYFLTKKAAEALGDAQNQVVFVGGFTANDRIIKTEDGRVWLVKERERNLHVVCDAVIQLQGILALSFVLASAVGAVLGGPLVGFLITAGDVAIDVNQAGGIRKFLQGLKKDPLKAGLFMLDLVTAVGDVKGMRALLTNPVEALEASMRAAQTGARARRALPAGKPPVDGAAPPAARREDGAEIARGEGRPAEVARGDGAPATTRPTSAPASPASTTGGREVTRPTDVPRPALEAPPRTRAKGELEVEVTDRPRRGGDELEGAAATPGRRPRPPARKVRKADGTTRNVRHRRPPRSGGEKRRGAATPGAGPLRGSGRSHGARGRPKDPLVALVGRSKTTRATVDRLEALGCGALARDIAEELAGSVQEGRKLLQRIAALPDEEIRGLAAVRRAFEAEPVVRSFRRPRARGPSTTRRPPAAPELRSTTGTVEMDWLDVLDLPAAVRGDLLVLVARVEPVTDAGLSRVIGAMFTTGRFSIQGALGHLHAAATLAERYRSAGVRMVMELPVGVGDTFRVVDIQATIGGTLRLDVEVKTYLSKLIVYEHVQRQLVKDLVRHVDDGWAGLRYVLAPQVGSQLGEFRRAVLDAFESPHVLKALSDKGLDAADARKVLQKRLGDAADPMVSTFEVSKVGVTR